MSNPFNSLHYISQGLKLLRHPRLRLFLLLPLIINIAVFTFLIAISAHEFKQLLAWIDHFLPHWLQWLNWLLWPLFVIACLLGIAYLFSILANLIAAPFNSILAEKAELLITGANRTANSGLKACLKDVPRSIKHELQKILYYLPRAALCLVLFFIPGLQVVAPLIWFAFNAWMLSLEYLDYPADNHKLTFKRLRSSMSKHRSANLSFGAILLCINLIPIVNFIVMPLAVLSATIFWVSEYKKDATIPHS